jgi:hypothetical protein
VNVRIEESGKRDKRIAITRPGYTGTTRRRECRPVAVTHVFIKQAAISENALTETERG